LGEIIPICFRQTLFRTLTRQTLLQTQQQTPDILGYSSIARCLLSFILFEGGEEGLEAEEDAVGGVQEDYRVIERFGEFCFVKFSFCGIGRVG